MAIREAALVLADGSVFEGDVARAVFGGKGSDNIVLIIERDGVSARVDGERPGSDSGRLRDSSYGINGDRATIDAGENEACVGVIQQDGAQDSIINTCRLERADFVADVEQSDVFSICAGYRQRVGDHGEFLRGEYPANFDRHGLSVNAGQCQIVVILERDV